MFIFCKEILVCGDPPQNLALDLPAGHYLNISIPSLLELATDYFEVSYIYIKKLQYISKKCIYVLSKKNILNNITNSKFLYNLECTNKVITN